MLFSYTALGQTVHIHRDLDGGFENGDTFSENSWRVTNSSNPNRNQWVCGNGAIPGFTDRKAAYVSNNANATSPPHKYTINANRATHIFKDITIPANESDITLDFIWIAQGEGDNDRMRIWLVPITYAPTYGTEITATGSAPNGNIQIGGNFSGSSTWNPTPTLVIPPVYAGTTFRLVIEWKNNATLGVDPPAGIDDIHLVSSTPPPPSNDEPCNAINLSINPTCNYNIYSNYGATNSVSVPNPGCGNFIGGDVWFQFTVPASGSFVIDTQSGQMTDGGMALYSGTCGSLTLIECDDNDSSNGLMPAILRSGLTPGQTLYIRMWENGNDNNGTFGICITPPPPPPTNDECVDAVALTVNPSLSCTAITAGSTAYATASPQPDDVIGTPNNDVWFSFVATNTNHQISLLDIVPLVGSTGDLAIGVYSSSSGNCSTLAYVDDSNPETFNVTGLSIGVTYYVRVYGYAAGAATAQANFNICISTPPPPPPNNRCRNAIFLPLTPNCSYSTYTNAGATASTGVPAPGCANYIGGDVWFYVIADSTGEITIDTQAMAMTDGGMALYTGNCNSLTLLECDDNDSANGLMPSITLLGLTPGQIIYIRVWENGNDNNGTFGICATSPSPPGIVDVALRCPGDTSQPLVSTIFCSGTTNLGNTLSGILQGSDPRALQPIIFISSNDPCQFDPSVTSNYSSINFTVNTTGSYRFNLETPSPYFDAMGYIVVNNGNFIPGSCASGTYIAGDDDDGPSLNPQITATLTAGVPYKLITTKFSFTNTTHIGPYRWTVTGPQAEMEWFTAQTGGSPIATGITFNPIGAPGSGLTNTSNPGIYTFWANCPASTGPRYQADYIIGKNWKGQVNTDWNEHNNWVPAGKPTSDDCVNITNQANLPIIDYPGPPTPPNPGYAKTLNLASNSTLELAQNTYLTVQDWVTVANNATFIIRDDASLIQVTDVTSNANSGNIMMQRTVNGVSNQDYVYWSSPVENFNVSNISPGTNVNNIWHWVPTVNGNGVGNYGEWQHPSSIMQRGKGYIVRGLSGTTPLAPAPSNTAQFNGKPNNGIITVPIQRGTYSGANYPGAGSTIATQLDDNWNLIGNPYPSAILANAFINLNASELIDDVSPAISGTVYLWRHITAPSNAYNDPFYGDFGYNYNPNDYIKYNSTGSSPAGFSGRIAAGQGFFVLMDPNTPSTTSNVVFNNTMRRDTYRNDQFYRTQEETQTEIERHRIWLDLIAPNQYANSILVGYVEGATNAVDRLFDGHDLNDGNTRFYSMVENEKMVIQGKALPFEESDTVPLGVVFPSSGVYTIAINAVDGLFLDTEQPIFIEDTYDAVIHNLRQSPYQFTTSVGTFEDRFILRYTDETLNISTVALTDLNILVANEKVTVTSGSQLIHAILIYDITGRILINSTDINSLEHSIPLSDISNGTLIIKAIVADGRQKTKKAVH
ncbi:hypothetical protein M0G43_00225 [Subsaxibacter sp. CAU 1640]|uniref:hypothetical protein n=1 Tax=Subsaxibacter sp. CAU 1640 TaxID=2933271 RepID=UPI0020051704|nr:hypothetical protein [Subsaxibacter sp. CAU 1640]MCK7588989.1 hypothetical protein [Subsaxibacter sp. CAU 1640]